MNQKNISVNENIKLAEFAGFCFGVKRAVELMEHETKHSDSIFSIGELIHNKTINDRFAKKGVRYITRDEITGVPKDATVFIRAHGEQKDIIDKLSSMPVKLLDATCPFVQRIHTIVSDATENGDLVIIIGDSQHPEVESIMSHAKDHCICFESVNELKDYFDKNIITSDSITVVAQTTLNVSIWRECRDFIKARYPQAKIHDTICSVTEKRQNETKRLAGESDVVVVIGGKNSSNTAKLFDIAKKYCKNAIHIETADELKNYPATMFREKKIGITAGASTPSSIIQEVILTMTEIINEELSFAELLDSTFKTLNTGERVTGTISAVTPAEIHVDLGIKQTGIIPFDEVTEDTSVDLLKEYVVGNSIEAIVIKFNDSEGTVLLSKKKIDALKNWDKISETYESGEIIYAKVKESIKGGYIVLFDALRVFVPASQSGVGINEDPHTIVGEKVPLKIIEVNKQKRRVIGSIKQAKRILNKKIREEFFEKAEVGQKYTGIVRSIMPYGVFVDLGGVDGMVHISQLTWKRIKEPSEVVSVGDKIDVYIREIDTEKKRISLGCKLEEDNPWIKFEKDYKVGDVIDVKIVNLFPFGAFAEIIPGVDGLIHISQASDRQLKSVSEVFKPDDVVKVKITAIKNDAHKVSLSVRALLEGDTIEIDTNDSVTSDSPVEETQDSE